MIWRGLAIGPISLATWLRSSCDEVLALARLVGLLTDSCAG